MHDLITRTKAVVHYCHFVRSLRKVAKAHAVGTASLSRWVKNGLADGHKHVAASKSRALPEAISPIVVQIVRSNPFVRLDDIVNKLKTQHGVCASRSTVHRAMKLAGLSHKLAQRDSGDDSLVKPHSFFEDTALEGDSIAIDETCFYLNDSRRRGWGPKGSRVRKAKMNSRIKVSMVLAIGRAGVVASETIYGNFNTASFADFLKRLPTGRRLVMDNVAFHKAKAVRVVASSMNNTLVFTPPYCPWFNPTEYAFSVAKTKFRSDAVLADIQTSGLAAFADSALTAVTPDKCDAFFSHAAARVACVAATARLEHC